MKTKLMMILTAASLSIATTAFGFGTSKFAQEVETEASAIKLVREVQQGGYQVISTEELNKAVSAGESIVIVDTMPYEDSYKKNHIPGAVQFLFPIPEMSEWKNEETDGKSQEEFVALLGPDKAKKIVVYCGFVKCTRSHNGAMWAKKLGYTNVYRHPGGIYAWKGADLPVATVQ